MGVSGSGKTAVGQHLADQLGWQFRDADEFHPAANVAKMSAGIPLVDADRWPWLDNLAAAIGEALAREDGGLVIACSALARRYRERMGLGRTGVRVVFLDGPAELIRARLEARRNHFMPASLLTSQLAILERPTPDERPITVGIEASPEEIVARIVAALRE
ncbi:MAG: gluconokinase [Planctomycetota bacterium]|nr:MAG: gluconokinase [Planctomycetota bacterium]